MERETKELIKKFKEGDKSSFEKIVNLYASRVSNIIYHILGGNSSYVDDLSQEVFIKIYKNLEYFRQESRFSTWIYRITVNTVWDYLRKQKNRKAVSLDKLQEDGLTRVTAQNESVRANVKREELKEILGKLINEIPLKYRTVLILKEIEDLSYKEIAKIIGCSIGTVESRLYRARMALKEKIKKSPLGGELL